MAIDEATVVEEARRNARRLGKILDAADIRDSLPVALQKLGPIIHASSEYALQQKEFTVTLTSGVADLSSQTDLVIDSVEWVKHPSIDGAGLIQRFSRIPDGDETDLATWLDSVNPPYIIENNKLKCSLGNGSWPDASDLPPDTASLKLMAGQVPTLANLDPRFKDELVMLIVADTPTAVAA
jgi:hypothetical protein